MTTIRSTRSMTAARRRIQEAAIRLFAERGSANVTMSDLAQAAGVARGTVHNNLESPEVFFRQIANDMASEMYDRITVSSESVTDPVQRLALGIRFYVRRAHEEPDWGRFLRRFAVSEQAFHSLWLGQPARDLQAGIVSRRYAVREDQLSSAISFVAGGVLGAISLVLDGHRTWRDAGADAVEFCLRGLGVDAEEASFLATSDLPPLKDLAGSARKRRRDVVEAAAC